jgi:ankyrin repeat protein
MSWETANGNENWARLVDNTSGWMPLHFLCQAVNRGHLLAQGARRGGLELLGSRNEAWSCSSAAADLVRWLVRAGCELNAPIVQRLHTNAVGFAALHLLVKPHQKWTHEQLDDVLALMEALLEHGALPDSEQPGTGRTPLSLAAAAGQYEAAELLCKFGADPLRLDRDRQTVIERCRRGSHWPMAKMLEVARRKYQTLQDMAKRLEIANQRARHR